MCVYIYIHILTLSLPSARPRAAEIYDEYRLDYQKIWENKIKMAMKQTTKNYDTSQFFQERLVVTEAIKNETMTVLKGESVEVESVHVGQITIPPRFEEAITTKVVTQQKKETITMQRQVTLIEANTTIVNSRAESEAEFNVESARARASVVVETASASGNKLVRKVEAEGLEEVRDALGWNVDQLLELKMNREVRKLGSSDRVVVGWENAHLSTKERS